MLAFFAAALSLPPLPTEGCPTAACSAHRDGNTASLNFTSQPQQLWLEPALSGNAAACSGNGKMAICTFDDGSVAAFNAEGLLWNTTGTGRNVAHISAPFISSESPYAVSGTLEGVGVTRTVLVRNVEAAGIFYSLLLDEGSIGPWLLPNVVDENALMLVVQGDGILLGINVEIQLCWAAVALCVESSVPYSQCTIDRPDSLRPINSPAISNGVDGGAAFFAATLQHPIGPSSPAVHIVRVTIGDMSARLLPVHLGSVNGSALPSDGSAPLLIELEDEPRFLLLVLLTDGLAAVKVDDDPTSSRLELAWRIPLEARGAEGPHHAAANSDLGLVLDPREGVWVPMGGGSILRARPHRPRCVPPCSNRIPPLLCVGSLGRISTADGSTLNEVTFSKLGLGPILMRPTIAAAPTLGGLVMLAASASASGGGCMLSGIDLEDGSVRWTFEEGVCPAGQMAIVGNRLLFARRERGGVVALGEAA